ncbi:hypothetical protein CHELA40_10490 [Chelatococcus asaccharovorans]|nr:hypothetical protein CHELA40_10490 [Chelatococcus asaccharovorans]CAH1686639.1 hypothetical protein CHELA17_65116 [Chelatococcus asaccharovorans]
MARLGRHCANVRAFNDEDVGLLLGPQPDHGTFGALRAMRPEQPLKSLRTFDVLPLHACVVEMPDGQQVGRDRGGIFLRNPFAIANGERALVDAELQRGLEEIIFRLRQPAARQHPFERRQPEGYILGLNRRLLINRLDPGFGLDQRRVAAFQAYNHARKPLGVIDGDGEVKAEVAVAEARISEILTEDVHLAGANAAIIKEGQNGAIPGAKGFRVKPSAYLIHSNKLDRSADHKRSP